MSDLKWDQFPEKPYRVPSSQFSAIETNMRPGVMSHSGFISPTERLADVLTRDERTVKNLKTSHQKIADWLNLLFNAFDSSSGKMTGEGWMEYQNGNRILRIRRMNTGSGGQFSPFGDMAPKEITRVGDAGSWPTIIRF